MSTKAREFWLEISPMIEREIHNEKPRDIFPHNRIVHVIEYSAYEELKRQNEIMVDALMLYSDKKNWNGNKFKPIDFDNKETLCTNDEPHGKRAREALAKCGKITNKD